MADHTIAGLRAAIKALKDTVGPAVDPHNPLANEQLRMVCGYLALVCEQLPHRAARIAFELRSAIALAEALRPVAARCDAGIAAALDERCSAACAVRDEALPDEAAVQHATDALNAAVSALVRAAAETPDADARSAVERVTLAHARQWVTVQRAWFAPLGLDPDRASVPRLAAALAGEP